MLLSLQQVKEARIFKMFSTSKLPVPSRWDSRTSGRKPRSSSTSRVSQTPSKLRRSKSHSSLYQTPQSANSKTKKKDPRPLHEKQWQAKAVKQTQAYFQNDREGSLLLNNRSSLRPFTLTMFVQLINILLKKIDPKLDELSSANYVELLPKHLLMLGYPGVVTASTLKTANTIHAWPHVLGILSWLVSFHNVLTSCAIDQLFNVAEDSPLDVKVKIFRIQTQMDFFVAFNKDEEIEDSRKIVETEYKKITNFSDGKSEVLKTQVDQLKNELEVKKQQTEEDKIQIEECKQALKTEKDRQKLLDETLSQQKKYKKDVENKISECKKEQKYYAKEIKIKCGDRDKLKMKVKTESMSKQQNRDIAEENKQMEQEIALLRESLSSQQLLRDKKDLTMSRIISETEKKINLHNTGLMELSLAHPEVKELSIRKQRITHPDMHQCLDYTIKKTEKLRRKLEKNITELKNKMVELTEELQNRQTEFENVQETVSNKSEKAEKNKEKCEALNKSLEKRITENKKKIDAARNKTTELQDSKEKFTKKYQEQKEELERLKLKVQCLEQRKQKKREKMALFFKNLLTEVEGNQLPKYGEIRKIIWNSVCNAQDKLKNPERKDEKNENK